VKQVLESIIGYLSTLGIILMETGQRLAMNAQTIAESPLSNYGAATGSTTVFNLALAPLVDHLGPLMESFGGILNALSEILRNAGI
jgi:hypothetical protein